MSPQEADSSSRGLIVFPAKSIYNELALRSYRRRSSRYECIMLNALWARHRVRVSSATSASRIARYLGVQFYRISDSSPRVDVHTWENIRRPSEQPAVWVISRETLPGHLFRCFFTYARTDTDSASARELRMNQRVAPRKRQHPGPDSNKDSAADPIRRLRRLLLQLCSSKVIALLSRELRLHVESQGSPMMIM
jgi:hypothetical protein